MIGCVVCKLGPEQGVSLFRINEKGVPGLYACRKHVHQTDAHLDAETVRLVDILDPPPSKGPSDHLQPCLTCDGTGDHPDDEGEPCPTCDGDGFEPYDLDESCTS